MRAEARLDTALFRDRRAPRPRRGVRPRPVSGAARRTASQGH